jgi:hypothetical protein
VVVSGGSEPHAHRPDLLTGDQPAKICPVCGEEIDADDDACPDDGDLLAGDQP